MLAPSLLGPPISFNNCCTVIPELFRGDLPGSDYGKVLDVNVCQVGVYLDTNGNHASGGELDGAWSVLGASWTTTFSISKPKDRSEVATLFTLLTLATCCSLWVRLYPLLSIGVGVGTLSSRHGPAKSSSITRHGSGLESGILIGRAPGITTTTTTSRTSTTTTSRTSTTSSTPTISGTSTSSASTTSDSTTTSTKSTSSHSSSTRSTYGTSTGSPGGNSPGNNNNGNNNNGSDSGNSGNGSDSGDSNNSDHNGSSSSSSSSSSNSSLKMTPPRAVSFSLMLPLVLYLLSPSYAPLPFISCVLTSSSIITFILQ